MKFYLSSFRLGTESSRLLEIANELIKGKKRVAYISNALDYFEDLKERKRIEACDIADLEQLGFEVELLDLREYFKKPLALKERINSYDVFWVSGGNVFILRQAMYLSGFDTILNELYITNADVIYGGYSAGVCVLAPRLHGLHLVDSPEHKTYGDNSELIWKGLDIINYMIVPHYRSSHFESEEMEKVVQYMIENKVLFIALKDGEVIIIE